MKIIPNTLRVFYVKIHNCYKFELKDDVWIMYNTDGLNVATFSAEEMKKSRYFYKCNKITKEEYENTTTY